MKRCPHLRDQQRQRLRNQTILRISFTTKVSVAEGALAHLQLFSSLIMQAFLLTQPVLADFQTRENVIPLTSRDSHFSIQRVPIFFPSFFFPRLGHSSFLG